jgi:hypothetical protein
MWMKAKTGFVAFSPTWARTPLLAGNRSDHQNAGESIIPTPKDTRLEETTEENEAQERTVVREA